MFKLTNVIIIFLVFTIIYVLFQLYETELDDNIYSLYKDGFVIVNDKNHALNMLPDGYVFIDYEYEIIGCTLQTFHRDVTSSAYYHKTKYPVYTLITYNNKGNLLAVCPSSHKTTPYVWSSPKIIKSNNENVYVLFNCDLVHSGAMSNLGNNRHAIQYKISHIEDLEKLKHLNGIKKQAKVNCEDTTYVKDYIMRKLSLLFSYPINDWFTPYLQENQNNTLNSIGLYIFGKKFYNK